MEARVEKEHIDCSGSRCWQRTVFEHSGKHFLNLQIVDVSITCDVQLFLTESRGEPVLNARALALVQLKVFSDTEKQPAQLRLTRSQVRVGPTAAQKYAVLLDISVNGPAELYCATELRHLDNESLSAVVVSHGLLRFVGPLLRPRSCRDCDHHQKD